MRAKFWTVLALVPAIACAAEVSESNGPNWQSIALGLLSLVVTWVGAYSRGLNARLDRMQEKLVTMELTQARDYHTKADIEKTIAAAIAPVMSVATSTNEGMKALHKRFDNVRLRHAAHDNEGEDR